MSRKGRGTEEEEDEQEEEEEEKPLFEIDGNLTEIWPLQVNYLSMDKGKPG